MTAWIELCGSVKKGVETSPLQEIAFLILLFTSKYMLHGRNPAPVDM